MRIDIDSFKNQISIELFDKIKEIRELNNVQFIIDKERQINNKIMQELQNELNALRKKAKTD